jgi:hypothetical protein
MRVVYYHDELKLLSLLLSSLLLISLGAHYTRDHMHCRSLRERAPAMGGKLRQPLTAAVTPLILVSSSHHDDRKAKYNARTVL